jgi:putative phosphoribosyl transferase
MVFQDRHEAGKRLAEQLTNYTNRPDIIVLALPRGGVPVAFEVAQALHTSLDVFVVRKLGVPGHEELALGALATGQVRYLNQKVVGEFNVMQKDIEAVTQAEMHELERRERLYRDDRPPPELRGKTVVLVDDGLATGASMYAAVMALRLRDPAKIVVAVPIASPQTCDAFRDVVDEVVCAVTPEPFYAVGLWYRDFSQTTDEEVRDLLARAEKSYSQESRTR